MFVQRNSTGEQLRDDGCQTAIINERLNWKNGYEELASEFLASLDKGETFIGEDIRSIVESVIGSPHHPNVWGAMARKIFNAWTNSGFVKIIGMRKAESPKNHASLYPIYQVQ